MWRLSSTSSWDAARGPQELRRGEFRTDAMVARVRAGSPAGKATTVALHLMPGVGAYLLLYFARRPLSDAPIEWHDAGAQLEVITLQWRGRTMSVGNPNRVGLSSGGRRCGLYGTVGTSSRARPAVPLRC